MLRELSPVLKANDLCSLYPAHEVVIIDARNGKNARGNYEAEHLEGALFVDLDTQLADVKPDASNGGRHPLPTLKQFSDTLTSLGITPQSHVVVYDDKNGSNAAARFWWMLKSVGHQKIQVLDGGLNAAVAAGFPVSSKTEISLKTAPYPCEKWSWPVTDISEVDKASSNDQYLIIDVRDAERFNGEKEPIDLIAGHIPGAVNVPFSTNLDDHGFFLSPAVLKHKYLNLFANRDPDKIIVHCGSGVTACHTILAIAAAGLDVPTLYVGSWSEWSRNNRPMVTKMQE
jgi:thiosulfate/3-mercaptopyruvate sulfurtransferase